jgi:hypothetical protein
MEAMDGWIDDWIGARFLEFGVVCVFRAWIMVECLPWVDLLVLVYRGQEEGLRFASSLVAFFGDWRLKIEIECRAKSKVRCTTDWTG